ncbi:hypothetical protein SAMN05216412_11327 [Nitrosospira multiformis]|uniref:Uncharacterized protein n=1 Tax=Nitrosospira multiformis TaxID=1231 RepID=A0A1I0GFQ0_9PROT|nr:hypothetical protein SAMN05216412_11327 [Nitrosospira multiformis]
MERCYYCHVEQDNVMHYPEPPQALPSSGLGSSDERHSFLFSPTHRRAFLLSLPGLELLPSLYHLNIAGKQQFKSL